MRQLASLSLDLDNRWSYLKTHGDPAWQLLPSYLPSAVPLLIRSLDALQLPCTFFVVGQDAATTANRAALQSLADHGYEIANHSFHHEPWLHRYPRAQVAQEIEAAEDAIHRATGQRPVGFRGPGYSLSADVLRVLAERDYLYDASTIPTTIGAWSRLYSLRRSGLDRAGREQRSHLFGRWSDGFRPLRPYRWSGLERTVIELPVTTTPLLRLPFHGTYLLYLARRTSPAAALFYWRCALWLCSVRRVEPSIILHPLDFLGGDEEPELRFFPAMDLAGGQKRALMHRALGILRRRFDVVTLAMHARAAAARPGLRERSLPAAAR